MRNFQLLQKGLDVTPLLHAIERQSELWNQNDLRSTYPGTPHTEIDDIWLRFNATPDDIPEVMDGHESINYPAMYKLPQAHHFIFGIMAKVDGERLGRVLVTRLKPGGEIAPHVDGGEHAAYYDRYHLVLQGFPGSEFYCGNEQVNMQTGDVWWFDNSVEHRVVNNSADDRIHLVVDVRAFR